MNASVSNSKTNLLLETEKTYTRLIILVHWVDNNENKDKIQKVWYNSYVMRTTTLYAVKSCV